MRIQTCVLISALLFCFVQSGPVPSINDLESERKLDGVNLREVLQNVQDQSEVNKSVPSREIDPEEQPVDEEDIKRLENDKKQIRIEQEQQQIQRVNEEQNAEQEKKEAVVQVEEDKKVENEKKEVQSEEQNDLTKAEPEKKEVQVEEEVQKAEPEKKEVQLDQQQAGQLEEEKQAEPEKKEVQVEEEVQKAEPEKKEVQVEEEVQKAEPEKKEVQLDQQQQQAGQLEEEKQAEPEKKEVQEEQHDEENKAESEKKEEEHDEDDEQKKAEMEKKSLELEHEHQVQREELLKKHEDKRAAEQDIAVERSPNTTDWEKNPCESNKNFNYFQVHPSDETKYIECDPWGTGLVRSCENGTVWNTWALKCDQKESIKNMTWSFVPQSEKVFNCSSIGFECLNGGVCTENEMSGNVKCICKEDFTGQFCELRVDKDDLTHAILNGTFSIQDYIEQLRESNLTSADSVSDYVKYKDQLDNVTYSELIKYLSMYKDGEIRYDVVVTTLVENILEDIYPDAAYLSSFNGSEISVVDLVRVIPNLLSYSRYSVERYTDVFSKYQSVLTRLNQYMNNKNETAKCREHAAQYARLTAVFMNQTMGEQMNQTVSSSQNVDQLIQQTNQPHVQMSENQIRDLLKVQYNSTLQASEKLFQSLEKFQAAVEKAVEEKRVDVERLTLDQVKLEGSEEVRAVLQSITSSSSQIWDSLVNYGFWFVTTYLANPVVSSESQAAQNVSRV